jgi:copper chaperone CopZ
MPARTLTLHIEGMHCASCGLVIDEQLDDLEGVLSSRTSVRKGISTVVFDADRCSPTKITEAIASAGYQARPSARR